MVRSNLGSIQVTMWAETGRTDTPPFCSTYIHINELIVEVNSNHVGCHIDGVAVDNLSYADDTMVLLSTSICGLKSLLSACQSYADKHNIKV